MRSRSFLGPSLFPLHGRSCAGSGLCYFKPRGCVNRGTRAGQRVTPCVPRPLASLSEQERAEPGARLTAAPRCVWRKRRGNTAGLARWGRSNRSSLVSAGTCWCGSWVARTVVGACSAESGWGGVKADVRAFPVSRWLPILVCYFISVLPYASLSVLSQRC